ncbi:uncharacterized protein LOC116800206 [Drosophila sechellia]|uniref:uncharacterized protein LOC116800206 n=1 Tax=Drosophila sechellia TaxID=7238 RepID=UPI0013DE3E8E|nr:uncharacterized protein LOC116800206 [Drosophila sechellia]
MMSEKTIQFLKKQSEIILEIRKLEVKPTLTDVEILKLNELQKCFIANHSNLLKIGVVDHEYFNAKQYDLIMMVLEKIKNKNEKIKGESVENTFPKSNTVPKSNPPPTLNLEMCGHPEKEGIAQNNALKVEQAFRNNVGQFRVYLEDTSKLIDSSPDFLKIRKNKIEFLWHKIDNLIEQVNSHFESSLFEEEISELEFDKQNILTAINSRLSGTINKAEMSTVVKAEELPTLPKIQIPTFLGDSKEWDLFNELFTELIHVREDLSPSLKFNYLKSALKGEARNVVTHLLLGSGENYEATWEFLTKRYENKRNIFSDHMNRLMDMPNLNLESNKQIKTFIDTINESIYIIKLKAQLPEDVDAIFAHIILRKFNKESLNLYESHVKKTKEIQALSDVMDFLEQRLNSISSFSQEVKPVKKMINNNKNKNYSDNCAYCKLPGHYLIQCHKFKIMNPAERSDWVRKNGICLRCLRHPFGKKCISEQLCSTCRKPHHTLLHFAGHNPEKVNTCRTTGQALLATALIQVKSRYGGFEQLRALIDSGAQSTIISEESAQILKLKKFRSHTEISGVSSTGTCISKHKAVISIRNSPKNLEIEAIILPKLMKALPVNTINVDQKKWKNFRLADPDFNKPGRIDLIIGADVYTHILQNGVIKIDGLLGQKTDFGWIVSGCKKSKGKETIVATTIEIKELDRYWEVEEEEKDDIESEICENKFIKTTKKDSDGRYIVSIPFKEDVTLGDSKKQAIARYMNLEKKLKRNEKLKVDYTKFMNEYMDLGHMIEVSDEGKYFLPHQAVIRDSSLTTKLRVVFDASAKTTNNKSLNDIMWVGPRVQKDIFDIIIKWRKWEFVVSADIEKMYRQIKIDNDDQKYQYILWRNSPKEKIKTYKLTTVTYGTASAPYLATRVLVDIADKCKNQVISAIIRNDFYMDDLMTGADSVEEANKLITLILHELQKVGFNLRKWISNNSKILTTVEDTGDNKVLNIIENECVKTLGLKWEPQNDLFKFSVNCNDESKNINKRVVLSTLAKIFDPLGWLAPVTVSGKLFIQKLWINKSEWDQELSIEDKNYWEKYKENLLLLENIRIPRWINSNSSSVIQIHGFADASEKAYAAVVYAKVGPHVNIIASKSRVNPIKNRKTIPKLELCAAHLLSELIQRLKGSIDNIMEIYAWSDSTITLAWINSGQSKIKFIKRRTDDIRKLKNTEWNHVKSEDNPADLASRGVDSNQLINCDFWWKGPKWLADPKEFWPRQQSVEEPVLINTVLNDKIDDPIYELIERYSSIEKLIRIIAYINRFVQMKTRNKAYSSIISVKEIRIAETVVIKKQQEYQFRQEIKCLKIKKEIKTNNKILSLNPFLDKDGVLRVGGRLQNSNAEFNVKHPIILEKCHLTSLLIKNAHKETLHGGINLMRNYIQRKYWIFGLKNSLKKYLRECVTCARYKQNTAQQIMGNLPKYRVTMTFPFLNTGIDYAGPYYVKCSKNRGQKTFKGYVAVFVCMATKAIHLEMVSDLTSDAFLAALRRFIARRGKCSNIYSDNGTNFVGAARKLDQELFNAIQENITIAAQLEKDRIDWHFIPPAGPHFGGIWEAGVKSMKYHLKRIIGDTILTYEEMSTLLCQIEACLNSRPLYTIVSEVPKIIWDPLKLSILNHTEEFERLNNEIKFMKENHQKLKDLHFHHISGHAGLIIALILMIVLIIYFIRKCAVQQRMQAITFAGPLPVL